MSAFLLKAPAKITVATNLACVSCGAHDPDYVEIEITESTQGIGLVTFVVCGNCGRKVAAGGYEVKP